MFFFEITSKKGAEDFAHWLEHSKHKFPILFYLNGITYGLADQEWSDCFVLGFKAAMQINQEIK